MLFPDQFDSLLKENLTLQTKIKVKKEEHPVIASLCGTNDLKTADPFNYNWGCTLYTESSTLYPRLRIEWGFARLVESTSSAAGDYLEIRGNLLSDIQNRNEALLECIFKLSILLGYAGSFHMIVNTQEKSLYMQQGFEMGHSITLLKPSHLKIREWQEKYKIPTEDLTHGIECRKKRDVEVARVRALKNTEEPEEFDNITFQAPLIRTEPNISDLKSFDVITKKAPKYSLV